MTAPFDLIPHLGDTQVTYTPAQSITLPYTFETIDFSGTPSEELSIDLVSVPVINQIGSVALTLYSILEEYNIFIIFIILLLSVMTLLWIWRLVTDVPSTVSLNLFGGIDVASDLYEAHLDAQEQNPINDVKSRLSGTDDIRTRRERVRSFRKISRSIKRLR